MWGNINEPAQSDEHWIDMATADGASWEMESNVEEDTPKQNDPD